jgi:hypothetical protein
VLPRGILGRSERGEGRHPGALRRRAAKGSEHRWRRQSDYPQDVPTGTPTRDVWKLPLNSGAIHGVPSCPVAPACATGTSAASTASTHCRQCRPSNPLHLSHVLSCPPGACASVAVRPPASPPASSCVQLRAWRSLPRPLSPSFPSDPRCVLDVTPQFPARRTYWRGKQPYGRAPVAWAHPRGCLPPTVPSQLRCSLPSQLAACKQHGFRIVPRFCASLVALSLVPILTLLSTAAVSEHRGTSTCFPTSPTLNQDSPSFNGAFGRPRPRNACGHYSHFCPPRGSLLFSVRISQKGDPRGPHSQPKCVAPTCRSGLVERTPSSAWPTQVSMLLLLSNLGMNSFDAPSCPSVPVHASPSIDQPSRNVYAHASTPSLFATNARHREHVPPVCTQAQMTLLHS